MFLSLVHAVFRPRSMRSKATRLSDDVKTNGGFSIEVGLIKVVARLLQEGLGRVEATECLDERRAERQVGNGTLSLG